MNYHPSVRTNCPGYRAAKTSILLHVCQKYLLAHKYLKLSILIRTDSIEQCIITFKSLIKLAHKTNLQILPLKIESI
jgi:hypothetical protein